MFRPINKTFAFINRKIPILIHTPRTRSFGNCAEDIFFGLLKAKRDNKKVLFLSGRNILSKKLVANPSLFRISSDVCIENRAVIFLGGWVLTGLLSVMRVTHPLLRILGLGLVMRLVWPKYRASVLYGFYKMIPKLGRSTLWKPEGVSHFSWETVKELDWSRQYEEYSPPKLMAKDYRIAQQLRVEMGIPLGDWFACLHVREGGFHGDSIGHRNGSIQNYIEGIEAITAAGGWVVRIGDSSMSQLPILDRVIDYPHTRFKSELMDIYLISDCRLFVGTNSGPSDVAALFKKPKVLVNLADWSIGFPVVRGDLALIKHIFSRSRNRFLSIKEILDEPYTAQGFFSLPNEYEMIENTSEEIRQVIEEFLAAPDDYEYSDLQKDFNESRSGQMHRWLDNDDEYFALWQYRFGSRANAAAGTLGQKYLEQNWSMDNLQNSSSMPPVSSAN